MRINNGASAEDYYSRNLTRGCILLKKGKTWYNVATGQGKGPEIGATVPDLHPHIPPARPVTQQVEDKQIWLDNQSADFSHIRDLQPPPSRMLLFVTPTLSCWAMILEWTLPSHQALFSPGNHPCPYVCSPGSCHDNSLCVIRLLFMEWCLNDHFMDRWNTLMWIKKW